MSDTACVRNRVVLLVLFLNELLFNTCQTLLQVNNHIATKPFLMLHRVLFALYAVIWCYSVFHFLYMSSFLYYIFATVKTILLQLCRCWHTYALSLGISLEIWFLGQMSENTAFKFWRRDVPEQCTNIHSLSSVCSLHILLNLQIFVSTSGLNFQQPDEQSHLFSWFLY